MKIVIAPDSFKGSASAAQVAEAVRDGWLAARPGDTLTPLPVADGGEGTVRAIWARAGAASLWIKSHGALFGWRHNAAVFVSQNGETAVIELAMTAGLTQIHLLRRDPKVTTTYGFGELIARAASVPGVKRLVLALGGSATNDGGAGALQALGVRFAEETGHELRRGGAALADLQSADFGGAYRFPDLGITIACDVDNPLLGERGATYVFAPQKGATPDDLPVLEAAMTRYAAVLTEATGRDVRDIPGTGAAGGTAAGLLWLFPQATLRPGIEIVLDAIGFDNAVRDADVVITGEGRLDAQTLGGKAVAGVIRRTKSVNPRAKVIAIVGSVAGDADELARALGLSAVYPLASDATGVANAMQHPATHLQNAAEHAARDFTP